MARGNLIRYGLRFSIVPDDDELKTDYKKIWQLDLQFEGHPQIKARKRVSLKTRLEDSRTIRNAIVHEECKVNGMPIVLTEDYIKFSFTFMKHIVSHLAIQWEDYYGGRHNNKI